MLQTCCHLGKTSNLWWLKQWCVKRTSWRTVSISGLVDQLSVWIFWLSSYWVSYSLYFSGRYSRTIVSSITLNKRHGHVIRHLQWCIKIFKKFLFIQIWWGNFILCRSCYFASFSNWNKNKLYANFSCFFWKSRTLGIVLFRMKWWKSRTDLVSYSSSWKHVLVKSSFAGPHVKVKVNIWHYITDKYDGLPHPHRHVHIAFELWAVSHVFPVPCHSMPFGRIVEWALIGNFRLKLVIQWSYKRCQCIFLT